MHKIGAEDFNYNSFKLAYDSDPMTQGLVKRFDQNGVELQTKVSNTDTAPSDAERDSQAVNKMAKSATKRARS